MQTELTKNTNGIPALIYESMVPKLEAFTQKLNERPAVEEIKINKAAKNSKYLPISFVRIKLDEMFAGIWNFTMIREQVIANEIESSAAMEEILPEMENCKNINDLLAIWNRYPDLHNNAIFKKYFGSQRQRIILKSK